MRYRSWAAKFVVIRRNPFCERNLALEGLDEPTQKRRELALKGLEDLARLVIDLLSDPRIEDTEKLRQLNGLKTSALTENIDV